MKMWKSTRVYDELLDEIYSGVLMPGQAIRERREGVSQATVGRALILLAQVGVVKRDRETTVTNLSQQDVANLIAVRIPLEQLACELARQHLKAPEVLAQARERLRRIGVSPRADEEFHHFIWDLSGNEVLIRTLKQVCAPMFAFVAILRRAGLQQLTVRIRSHETFLDALTSEDTGSLSEMITSHVREAYSSFQASGFVDMKTLAMRFTSTSPQTISDRATPASKDVEFLRSMPAVVLVKDCQHQVLYANREFERLSGLRFHDVHGARLDDPFWRHIEEIVASERVLLLVAERQHHRQRMTLVFPIEHSTSQDLMIGEFGVDITTILPLAHIQQPAAVPLEAAGPTAYLTQNPDVSVVPGLLTSFFRALPAVATWKDMQGRLLWANAAYEKVTGKAKDEAIGHLSSENWPGPCGEIIAQHDSKVRLTQQPYMTIDRLTFQQSALCRLSLRFPVFDDHLHLAGTATIGFSQELLVKCDSLLRALPDGDRAFNRIMNEPSIRKTHK
jgi:DNA-binding GntR family transcriptional regulator